MRLMGQLKRERLKTAGIYLVIILVVLKFVLIPLSHSVEDKKTLLNEYTETYRTKALIKERQLHTDKTIDESISEEGKRLFDSLYKKDSAAPVIQSEILMSAIKGAEKNEMDILNFELPDTISGKNLSEISVLLRLKGMPKGLIGLLKEIGNMKRPVDIKGLQIDKSRDEFVYTLTLTTYRIER